METTIDRAGRVVIPKPIRQAAGMQPGVRLAVAYQDGRVVIEPVCAEIRLVRRGPHWVLAAPAGAPSMTTADVRKAMESLRERRGSWTPGQGSD